MEWKRFFPTVFPYYLLLLFHACAAFPTEGNLVIELSSGFDERSGRVEVGYTGSPVRYPICADHFGKHAAQVVCRVLGFNGESQVAKLGYFGRKGQGKWLSGLRCKGTETKLEDCPAGAFTSTCRKGEDAGVFCSKQDSSTFNRKGQWDIHDLMVCGVDMSSSVIKEPLFIEYNEVMNIPSNLLVPKEKTPQEVVSGSSPLLDATDRIARPEVIESTANFPWIAQIRYSTGDNSMYMCGATIISEFFVLTSARCATRSLTAEGFVRVGDFDVGEKDEYQRDYRIANLSTSAKRTALNEITDQDIALLQIKPDDKGKGIEFSQFVLPACLPSAYTPYLKSMICTIGGYGRDEFFKETKFLRIGTVPLLSRKQCKAVEVSHNYLREGLFCAGGIPWSSTGCSGDRGSPLICKVDGRSTLLGIDSISGCGTPSKISYYIDVQSHLPWIANTIKSMSTA